MYYCQIRWRFVSLYDFILLMEEDMEKRVVHEVRLSKPLMAAAIVASVGLLAIGLKPF